MSDDLYAPPTMPVYVDRLIGDTQDLSAEEFGVYWRLCLRQWPKGSIPGDNARQATIGGVTPQRMRAIRAAIGKRLKAHPTESGAIYSPFMETVRREMEARNARASKNGKKGANKRWQTHGKHDSKKDSNAIAEPSQNDEFQSPISITQVATLPESRESASPLIAFGMWFLQRGIELDVIDGSHALDAYAWAYRESKCIEQKFEFHGEAECKARSERLFIAKRAGRITRAVSLSTLDRVWEFSGIAAPPATENPAVDAYLKQLNAVDA